MSSNWERQWRKEGQKLAPSNTRFTSRPTTHLSQILTNTTLATHLAKSIKAPPKLTGATAKPRETPTKAQTEKKTPSQRVQNVLKYIIAQNPHGTLAKTLTTGKTTRKAQSAPPTPSKKPLQVDKKLVQVIATSSQIAKALSPLKALVMKSNVTQSSVKTKEAENMKIDKQEGQKRTETMESSPNVAQQSQTSNTDLNATNSTVDPITDKASEPDMELSQKDIQECSKTEGYEISTMENTSEEKNSDPAEGMNNNEQAKDSTSLVNTSDASKSTEPLVEKLEDQPPPPQTESECVITPNPKDSPFELDTQSESTVDTVCTISASPDTTPTTTSPVHSLKLDGNRKRSADSDPPPPVKKQALSLTLTTEEATLTQINKNDTLNPPITRSSRESLDFPSLSDEESNTTLMVQEETPTVDADKLLRSLSTDSYNREESELASELGVDPSLLDLTEFMGIIQPDGIPGTPTTPLSLPLISLPEHSSKASHTEVTAPTIGLEIDNEAAIDQSNEKLITPIQTESSVSAATEISRTTIIEGGLSSNESDVVQLTSKDFDILREIGMNEADLMEGIPKELAATIQAIANIEEEDTVPWKH